MQAQPRCLHAASARGVQKSWHFHWRPLYFFHPAAARLFKHFCPCQLSNYKISICTRSPCSLCSSPPPVALASAFASPFVSFLRWPNTPFSFHPNSHTALRQKTLLPARLRQTRNSSERPEKLYGKFTELMKQHSTPTTLFSSRVEAFKQVRQKRKNSAPELKLQKSCGKKEKIPQKTQGQKKISNPKSN